MQTSAIAAVQTLGDQCIQVMARQHHDYPGGAPAVAVIVPMGKANEPTQPSRILWLDPLSARRLAHYLVDCAHQVEIAIGLPQTEREALMAAITPAELDDAVSGLVGLSEC